MSGGSLNYSYIDYKIEDTADEIEEIIKLNNSPIPQSTLDKWNIDKSDEFPKTYYSLNNEVIKEFKKGVYALRKAAIYTHCIDYLLSGDYGEDDFITTLKERLQELNNQKL